MRSEAEIRERLEILRKQYEHSRKHPIEEDPEDPIGSVYKYKEQLDREDSWRHEMAILEWILEDEKANWRTSWMVEEAVRRREAAQGGHYEN